MSGQNQSSSSGHAKSIDVRSNPALGLRADLAQSREMKLISPRSLFLPLPTLQNVYQGYRGYLMNPQTSPQERVRAHDEMSRIEQGNLKPNEYAPQSQGQGQGYGQGYGQKR
ncbi:hypothetical protein JCM8097_008506 [Rhodosporidiobolus ruineniae]